MTTSRVSEVIEHLRRTVTRYGAGLTDGQLLTHYLGGDSAALEVLVRRHAPMVWGVCSRILPNREDLEDAFQATFLVFIRRAASIQPRELAGNFLYGVARQTALKARATIAKRRGRERLVAALPEPAIPEQPPCDDRLDDELARLPERYRLLIVLCSLEGRTRKEVARQLGCPENTVAGQLARAKEMLAKRLKRHGIVWAGGASVVLAHQASAVPTSVIDSTVKAAMGQAISGKVAALTDGVMAMLSAKFKAVVAVLLLVGLMASGAALLTNRTAAGQQAPHPAASNPMDAAREPVPAGVRNEEPKKDGVTAWGKELGGLQAGLSYRPGECRVYLPGETVKLIVRVRNVGKEVARFQYLRHFFIENPPSVVDDKGKPVAFKDGTPRGIYKPLDVTLAPGKEVELYELDLTVGEKSTDSRKASTLYGEGKFQLQYKRIIGESMLSSVAIQCDPLFRKLETGKLDLVVSRWIRRWAPEKQEAFTAWGKETGGLQAGLGFRVGEKRAYHHGEAVTLVIRLRNVSKDVIKFSYLQPFIEHSLIVTGSDGKVVPQPTVIPDIGERNAGVVELPPGKGIELHELRRQLRPASEGGIDKLHNALYATGKISVAYDQVLGLPGMGVPGWKLDPILARLATGKLPLEVKKQADETATPKAATRLYTPTELIQSAKSLKPDAMVVVQFKVRLVQSSIQIRKGPEEDAEWVVGHGPDDLALHPQDRLDWTREQFAVLLTATAKQQLTRLGIRDVSKHAQGKTIRVTGRMTSFNPIADDPVLGRQYEIVVTDVSQLEVVEP